MIQITLRDAEKETVYACTIEWLIHYSENANASGACKDIGDVWRLAMVIRIKKKLYFKPRLCPDCGRLCLFCKCHLSQRCKRCHKKHGKKRHNRRSHLNRRVFDRLKYGTKYKRMRKRLIKEHPYCALCGSETCLTVHHVGGDCEHYTVLCDRCHQAYERWNTKRRAKLCLRLLKGAR